MLSLIFFVSAALSQSAEQAAQYYQDQDWERAAAAYRAVVEEQPDNGRAWARLGLSLIASS